MPKNEYICDCNMVHKEMVQDTLSKMPENETLNNLADLFKIMGDTTRCKLLFALLQMFSNHHPRWCQHLHLLRSCQ